MSDEISLRVVIMSVIAVILVIGTVVGAITYNMQRARETTLQKAQACITIGGAWVEGNGVAFCVYSRNEVRS